ncbi:MAG: hypothetical protein E7350_02660 [Clostridiales bacterium]|nr:hypothetical protein [Clostridiales bacterium]
MSVSQIKTPSYMAKLKELYAAKQKVVLVDYDKSLALKAASELFSKKSNLIIVDDRAMANQVADILKGTLDCHVIGSKTQLDEAVQSSAQSYDEQAARETAAEFIKRYPHLIVAARDGETPILNAVLGSDRSLRGMFRDRQAKFCFSDILALCGYDFALIDNFFEQFEMIDPKKRTDIKIEPIEFDRIDFFGKEYFSPITASYKRLENIIDSVRGVVALSPYAVGDSVATLYAGLHLLHGEFAFDEAYTVVPHGYADYLNDCEAVNSEMVNMIDEDGVVSLCLRNVAGRISGVPRSVAEMRKYLLRKLEFMSEEETYLRTMCAFSKAVYGGRSITPAEVLDMLMSESAPTKVAAALCEMCFFGAMKSELEGKISSVAVVELPMAELKSILQIFDRYGLYHQPETAPNNCKVIKINRDNSGFEEYIRRNYEARLTDELTYSLLKSGNDYTVKCVAIERILDGRDENVKAELPALIVSKNHADRYIEAIRRQTKGYEIITDLALLSSTPKGEKKIFVTSYDKLAGTPYPTGAGIAFLADMDYDVCAMKNMISKLSESCATVCMLTQYSDASAQFIQKWHDILLKSEQRAIPLLSTPVAMRERSYVDYGEIVRYADSAYRGLNRIVSYADQDAQRETADKIRRLFTLYASSSAPESKRLNAELAYLLKLGPSFMGVFANSKYLGDEGEHVIESRYSYVPGKDGKKDEPVEKIERTEQHSVFFNVCLKVLWRACSMLFDDCAACKDKHRLVTNDANAFVTSVKDFFTRTDKHIKRVDKSQADEFGGIIFGDESGDLLSALDHGEVESAASDAFTHLENIESEAQSGNFFSVEFSEVDAIYKDVLSVYGAILGKHLGYIMDILDTATDKQRTSIETLIAALK